MPNPQSPLIITGMHRSGTSLVASLFHQAGINMGSEFVLSGQGNLRGHFEDADFVRFHQLMLERQGENIMVQTADVAIWLPEDQQTAQALIEARHHLPTWGWKDPRVCLFLKEWHALLPQGKFLFLYRHPLEVVLSLIRRGTDLDALAQPYLALQSWYVYNQAIYRFCLDYPEQTILVNTVGLLTNIDQFAEMISTRFQINLNPDILSATYHEQSFHQFPYLSLANDILQQITPQIINLYERLEAIAHLNHAPSNSTTSSFITTEMASSPFNSDWLTDFPLLIENRAALFELLLTQLAPTVMTERVTLLERVLREWRLNTTQLTHEKKEAWQAIARLSDEKDTLWQEKEEAIVQLSDEKDTLWQKTEQLTQEKEEAWQAITQLSEEKDKLWQNLQQTTLEKKQFIAIAQSLQTELQLERRKILSRVARKATQLVQRKTVMTKQPISAAQVLQEIQAELKQPTSQSTPMQNSITQTRDLLNQFRSQPVIGSLRGLKKTIYSLNHSTFSQQYDINDALLGLIETLSYDLKQYRHRTDKKIAQLERQLAQKTHPVDPTSADVGALDEAMPTQTQVSGLAKIHTAPIWMTMPERVVLYSLIYGLKPRYVMEIGTFKGGSATIICGAMDDNGFGELICVDPKPAIADGTWQEVSHRATLFQGMSPDILAEAAQAVPEPYDFVLIDGDHTYDGVVRDIEGTLPLLANEAYLLFHDCHYFEVEDGINHCLKKYPQLIDCGLISAEGNPQQEEPQYIDGRRVIWGGLRLLRWLKDNS
ncbi:CmcI family methyltransferase [Anaerolineales bacterium HSG25]|nr:CmcI family methyltransferase [Anaerolineales bacterium HSG25]